MEEKIYVKGFVSFPKNEKAPDFVIGTLIIDIADFKEFIDSNIELLTDYKDKKQLKIQMLHGKEGKINFIVDQYKKPVTKSIF